MFLIVTLSPTFSMIEDSRAFRFVSSVDLNDCFFILKIFTKFSVCLTDKFFSTILLAISSALFKPTNSFACPDDIFLDSINFKIEAGKLNNLRQFAIWLRLFPIKVATFSWSYENSLIRR